MEKELILIDCDGPMADPQALADHICMHLRKPRKLIFESREFALKDVLECTSEEIDDGFDRRKSTFTGDMYHPIHESIEAIMTLELFYDWAVNTARGKSGNGITERWSTRIYVEPRFSREVQVYHARGQGNLFGHLKEGEDKLELAIRVGAVYMIEDNPHEVAYFANSKSECEIICLAYPYNECVAIDFPHVFRGSWPEITQYLLRKKG